MKPEFPDANQPIFHYPHVSSSSDFDQVYTNTCSEENSQEVN